MNISRRTFLKGAAITLVVPLPVLAKIGIKEPDLYAFTITKLESLSSVDTFDKVVRGIATINSSPDGREHYCYFASHQGFEESMEDAVKRANPDIRKYFVDKFS